MLKSSFNSSDVPATFNVGSQLGGTQYVGNGREIDIDLDNSLSLSADEALCALDEVRENMSASIEAIYNSFPVEYYQQAVTVAKSIVTSAYYQFEGFKAKQEKAAMAFNLSGPAATIEGSPELYLEEMEHRHNASVIGANQFEALYLHLAHVFESVTGTRYTPPTKKKAKTLAVSDTETDAFLRRKQANPDMVAVCLASPRDYKNAHVINKSLANLKASLERKGKVMALQLTGNKYGFDQIARAWAINNEVSYFDYLPDWSNKATALADRNDRILRDMPEMLITYGDASDKIVSQLYNGFRLNWSNKVKGRHFHGPSIAG